MPQVNKSFMLLMINSKYFIFIFQNKKETEDSHILQWLKISIIGISLIGVNMLVSETDYHFLWLHQTADRNY